jgi:hypothetical protein
MRARAPEIPDLSNSKQQQRRTDHQFLVSILDGKGAHMPGFADKLNPEQARQLVEFIRSFGPNASRQKATSTGDFQKRFRELQKELDDLRKQFRELPSPPPRKP